MSVSAGDKIPDWVMERVQPERMRTMAAILRDPNPVHWDRESVDKLGFGIGKRTINQGPLGLSYMLNMLHDWAGPTSVRRVYMTFPQLVLDDYHVTAQGEVTGVREENGETLADCDIWLYQEENGKLLVGTAIVCVDGV